MKKIRILAQYYVDLMVKLRLVRFSILLASALVVLALVVQLLVTLVFHGHIESIDVARSVFFGLLITPWAVYFLSIVVEQLEISRQRLSKLVNKLEEMRYRDASLNQQLQHNIEQLNQEIAVRVKAEKARLQVLDTLQHEIDQREKTQIKLEQQSLLLRSFLDASPDLVYYRNENHEFSGCNRAMELLTGKSEQQLIGLTPWDIYRQDIAEKIIETDEQVFRHNMSLTYEQWQIYPDGRQTCFELRKVPFYDHTGKRLGLMGFGRDITERKRYQEAQESASREKTTFISTISHELRTPLNGIVGLSRILLDTKLSDEQQKYLKTIHVSAITLGHIFNDIIEMDKLERKNVKLDNQPIDFTSFITDLENIAVLLAQPKGLKFKLQLGPNLPPKILADGTRLRQILWNLIGNAVKFTQKGIITTRVYREQNDKLVFEVQDSGIGIPEVEQERIFAMYYQVKDNDGGKSATGAGIGLAVSRRLARSMGGNIGVSSQPGHGACFTLTVTAQALEEEASEIANDNVSLPALNVLLVEDIELNVVVACSVLERMGCTVDIAMTGKDALEMFAPEEYDLVLLDIQLPDMSGLDIARNICTHYSRDCLPPLIALTANVLKDKKEYMDAGMNGVLSKPLSVKALTKMIKKFWGNTEISEKELAVQNDGKDVERLIDSKMLQQYVELIGPQLLHKNLSLFEKMMPDYLAVLASNVTARDQKGIAEEGHKIKGAASSVGLFHLQQIAQKIQTPTLPAWWDNIQEWVDELTVEWQHDVNVLREWIMKQEKK